MQGTSRPRASASGTWQQAALHNAGAVPALIHRRVAITSSTAPAAAETCTQLVHNRAVAAAAVPAALPWQHLLFSAAAAHHSGVLAVLLQALPASKETAPAPA